MFIFLFTFLFSNLVFGEYRVYQYYVRSKIQNLTPMSAEIVTSTLNPVSYIAYHGGSESVEVNLLRSWQCMGNTAKAPFCTITNERELKGAPPVASTSPTTPGANP